MALMDFRNLILILVLCRPCHAFEGVGFRLANIRSIGSEKNSFSFHTVRPKRITLLKAWGNDDEDNVKRDEEEERLKILQSRRKTIRSTLRSAESQRNYRIDNGLVPEIDEITGKPLKSDSKLALSLSAFVIAAGAVTLRVGGRAALVSGLGLDFANGNPELKENMDQFLSFASSLGDGTEALLFVLAWTVVKVFCFDAGGIVLALSSGILFGGVIQGALFSAFAATIGSSVSYFLAKVDSPVRKKALELLNEYPSLRGIEKVVAEDGLKAVLTLRLAPILPVIPIGMYNYIYGVTNVPFFDFAGGIFLGSLKPYLLDSYLGYFGKEVIDGTATNGDGLQDVILLVVLGVSVLIGVFASQLAGETWESVTEEIETEKRKKKDVDGDETVDDVTKSLFGFDLPLWAIGAQIGIKEADQRIEDMILVEYRAAVWNCTDDNPPPILRDPAKFNDSPEVLGVGKGIDVAASICDGFVLGFSLIKTYFKYADPLYDESKDLEIEEIGTTQSKDDNEVESSDVHVSSESDSLQRSDDYLLKSLQILREKVDADLTRIKKELVEIL